MNFHTQLLMLAHPCTAAGMVNTVLRHRHACVGMQTAVREVENDLVEVGF